MRINGRTLRPSTLIERRFLLSVGLVSVHVPRRQNPFRVARRIEQMIRTHTLSAVAVRQLAEDGAPKHEPMPSPGLDLPFPVPCRESDDADAVG